MLMDYLGIAIAFVYVVLLFSLVVTALSQLTQSLLFLRARNLHLGLTIVLRQLRLDKSVDGSDGNALHTLNSEIASPFSTNIENFNRSATWIDKETLLESLDVTDLTPEQKKQACNRFEKLDGWLSKRFSHQMKIVGGVWAVLIVLAFQLSAIELLRDLSGDPKLQSSYVAAAERAVVNYEVPYEQQHELSTAAAQAIEDLSKNSDFEEIASLLEEISAQGDSIEELLAEAQLVLESSELGEQFVSAYQKEIERNLAFAVDAAAAELGSHLREIALFDFQIAPAGWSYWLSVENVIGSLITVMFLVLGAPFWFNNLKVLLTLKDSLKPAEK